MTDRSWVGVAPKFQTQSSNKSAERTITTTLKPKEAIHTSSLEGGSRGQPLLLSWVILVAALNLDSLEIK